MVDAPLQPAYDYKRYAILYVDDEEMSLKYFVRAFGERFRILTATSAQEGLQILQAREDEIGLLISDQRMPGEKGVWLLDQARQLRPRIIRILATAYTDMDAAIEAVNSGAIYKYVTKPWDPPQLENALARGLEFFIVQKERDQLLHEKLSVLHNLTMDDRIVSLGLLAAGMSHHIRNSLVAVKTFLDLVPEQLRQENSDVRQFNNREFWVDYYQSVLGQIRKINQLLNDLWSISEKQALDFGSKVDVRSIVAEVEQKLAGSFAKHNIRLNNQVPDSLPALAADKNQLTRLFELLFKDELVSLPSGSQISISAHLQSNPTHPREELHIEVRDDGPGLPQESLRVLFDPFAPRSDSPAEYGINLMACYFIVHHHGGKIEATSGGGGGTVFRLSFPTDPVSAPLVRETPGFLEKVLANEAAWERIRLADRPC